MTIELILCAICMLAAFPVSRAIGLHYLVFFGANLYFLGFEYADSSLLAMVFAILAISDILLGVLGNRPILFIPAIASIALSFEQIGNGDWLLNHSVYLSTITNAVIVGSLIKEYWHWMHGRSEH